MPLAGHDSARGSRLCRLRRFQSTCPLRGTTSLGPSTPFATSDFNPRAPCGARRCPACRTPFQSRPFQSTCPLRGTTMMTSSSSTGHGFQSTCPLRGTTVLRSHIAPASADFNPRAPCGARPAMRSRSARRLHFNPRAPCGARRSTTAKREAVDHFNPRAPCGARLGRRKTWQHLIRFQSTCPLRGTTPLDTGTGRTPLISIHVPLAGHDAIAGSAGAINAHFNPRAPCGARLHPLPVIDNYHYFNPRAPCGARPWTVIQTGADWVFQSTCPLRGTTFCRFPAARSAFHFNPRAPCGARRNLQRLLKCPENFNPRAPCGARPVPRRFYDRKGTFQSTCPLRGTTLVPVTNKSDIAISIHVPLAGHDLKAAGNARLIIHFNPRAPCGARPKPPR